jgi:hypothetical protein
MRDIDNPEEYVLEVSTVLPNADPASRYQLVERWGPRRRRLTKLKFDFKRNLGCDTLTAELHMPWDAWGVGYANRAIRFFNHVNLYFRGVRYWTGYVETVQPKLHTPETITLEARGYAHQAKLATISWNYARTGFKVAGEVGEIAGVVRSLFLLAPLALGTDPAMPHPLADSYLIHASLNRPMGLKLDKVTLLDALNELAQLAGNYNWGVDENRRFYFTAPQPWTTGTAQYGVDSWTPQPSNWNDGAAHPRYSDETVATPLAVPPGLPIEEQASFVIGSDVESVDQTDTIEPSKNVLLIVAPGSKAGDPPQLFTVADQEWIDYWGRRLMARVSTPFWSEEADVRAWGAARLRLMGRPQTKGNVKAITRRYIGPAHALGAVRVIDPALGTEIVERIESVGYTMDKNAQLVAQVEFAYAPPPDQYFAEQLRRDATLSQNQAIGERVPFVLRDRFSIYTDTWNAHT